MNRRTFLTSLGAAAGALVLPYEPKRVYSFGSEVGVVTFGLDRTLEPVRMAGVNELARHAGYSFSWGGKRKSIPIVTLPRSDEEPWMFEHEGQRYLLCGRAPRGR